MYIITPRYQNRNRLPILTISIILGLITCSMEKETETLRKIGTIDSTQVRLEAYQDFIKTYPESDSTLLAIRQILALYTELNTPEAAAEFIIDQLNFRSDPEIRKLLYSHFFTGILTDSLLENQTLILDTEYQQKYSTSVATALILFPHLNNCFHVDSLRNVYLRKFGESILKSEFNDIEKLRQLADMTLSCDAPVLIDLSSRFLVKALALTPSLTIDSLQNKTYGELYTQLAWNAFRQENWMHALNLISQATKYGDLDYQQGLILLGAAQAKTGELTEGWGRILEGLIQNPEAEKKSAEVHTIYTELFREIRGSRENPERFLKQYRASHR
jgi:hypothetical protein